MPLPPQNHDPLLHVRGLAFARNDEPVFGPLDFALDRGETLLVEGDNGSGKTTLLRVLAGMLPASGARSVSTGGRSRVTRSPGGWCSSAIIPA